MTFCDFFIKKIVQQEKTFVIMHLSCKGCMIRSEKPLEDADRKHAYYFRIHRDIFLILNVKKISYLKLHDVLERGQTDKRLIRSEED